MKEAKGIKLDFPVGNVKQYSESISHAAVDIGYYQYHGARIENILKNMKEIEKTRLPLEYLNKECNNALQKNNRKETKNKRRARTLEIAKLIHTNKFANVSEERETSTVVQ